MSIAAGSICSKVSAWIGGGPYKDPPAALSRRYAADGGANPRVDFGFRFEGRIRSGVQSHVPTAGQTPRIQNS